VDQVLESNRLGKLGLALLEVQGDAGSTLRYIGGFDRELALPVGLPAHAFGRLQARAPGLHHDTIGHDESRIEADPELADETRVLPFVAGHAAEEFRGARTRDGAQVFHEFIARHPDTVVGHTDRAGFVVVSNNNRELPVVAEQVRPRECFESQLVGCVRCVRDQLAQEYLLVAIQGVDHQLQELTHLGLESERLPGIFVSHFWVPMQMRTGRSEAAQRQSR
jgi:hypothetical protein